MSQEDIKLVFEPDHNFRYYLFDNDEEFGGIIVLQKPSSRLRWSVYDRVIGSEQIESIEEGEWTKTSLTTYSDDHLNTFSVYGGRVKLLSSQELVFDSSNQSFSPTLIKKMGNYTYFFLSEKSISLEDPVKIRVVNQ